MLPVPPDLIEGVEGAALALQDVLCRLGPGERLRAGVVLKEVVVDRGLEFADAGVAAAPDAP